jgi:hypothetical protein
MSFDRIDPSAPTGASMPMQPVQPVGPVPRPGRRSRSAQVLNGVLALAVAVAIGGVAFAVGRSTAPATAGANGNGREAGGNGQVGQFGGGFPTASGAPGGGRFSFGGASIEGKVTAVSPSSITLTTANGQTLTINLSATTTYHAQAAASSADVKDGSTVRVLLTGFGGNRANGGQGGAAPSASPGASANPQVPTLSATDVTVIP